MTVADTRERLQAIADHDFEVPEGTNPCEMVPELIEHLGSLDQLIRERSSEILEMWSVLGHFSDDALRRLGDQLADNLRHGIGEPRSDSVFTRSYASMALCGTLATEELSIGGFLADRNSFLPSDQVRRWFDQALASFREEIDLRVHVDGKGCADAVSHMGDLLHIFARNPHSGVEELEQILQAVADRLQRSSSEVFFFDEGYRLMRATYCVILRNELPLETLTSWIESFATTADGREWGFGSLYSLEHCDFPALVVRANVREALRNFQVQLQHGMRRQQSELDVENDYNAYYDRPVPNREELLDSTECTLRKLYKGVYPSPAP